MAEQSKSNLNVFCIGYGSVLPAGLARPYLYGQVYVSGAHGTKCYFLLRGLVRVLIPEQDPDTPGVVRYNRHEDLGPGDVSAWRGGQNLPRRRALLVYACVFVGSLLMSVFGASGRLSNNISTS